MKKFYGLLKEYEGGSYDQTNDGPNANKAGLPGSGGITPAPYRSFQADEEELNTPNGKMKGDLKRLLDGLRDKDQLDKNGLTRLCTSLEQIIAKI